MLELNQFRQSAFCLKIRMVLDAKKLDYKTFDITPGIGQLKIFKLSGQRKVPVLVDGDEVIHDSKAIVRHLEKIEPDPSLIPSDPQKLAIASIIEDWADNTMAKAARSALIKAASTDSQLRDALLPDELPVQLRNLVGNFPTDVVSELSEFVNQGEGANLLKNLKNLSELLKNQKYLVCDQLTIADIAVGAQLSLLKFPNSAGQELAGKGCSGFIDDPELSVLFEWRDQLENHLKEDNLH